MLGVGRDRSESGDTLVEVMLATVILSMVVVGSFSILNKGTATAYSILERTETRSRISQQLEVVQYFRDQYIESKANNVPTNVYPASVWTEILAKADSTNRAIVNNSDPSSCVPSNAFYMNQNSDGTYSLANYAGPWVAERTPRPGDGLWIEATSANSSVSVRYIDVYTKSCWLAADTGTSTLSSTLRLYDDR